MKNSKRAYIWRYIKLHGSISSWEGFVFCHYMHTAGFMNELKNKGVNIYTQEEHGHNTKYTRYFISPEEIRKAEANKWVKY